MRSCAGEYSRLLVIGVLRYSSSPVGFSESAQTAQPVH